jgi:hypothetical protein
MFSLKNECTYEIIEDYFIETEFNCNHYYNTEVSYLSRELSGVILRLSFFPGFSAL